jgi:hypothetical protein
MHTRSQAEGAHLQTGTQIPESVNPRSSLRIQVLVPQDGLLGVTYISRSTYVHG